MRGFSRTLLRPTHPFVPAPTWRPEEMPLAPYIFLPGNKAPVNFLMENREGFAMPEYSGYAQQEDVPASYVPPNTDPETIPARYVDLVENDDESSGFNWLSFLFGVTAGSAGTLAVVLAIGAARKRR